MAGTGIAPHVTDAQAAGFIADFAGEYSPLKAVALHVAARQIGRAVALLGQPAEAGEAALVAECEAELVRRYVGPDFCGLCGRYTDHQGEH